MVNERLESSNEIAPSDAFITQLIAAQGMLYGYVCTLLGGHADAADVLQETNLVLWRKADEYKPDKGFSGWAFKIAYFQVLAHRKRRSRDRLEFSFSEESLDILATKLEAQAIGFSDRSVALDECVDKLPTHQRELIRLRYEHRFEVKSLAQRMQKSENTIAAALYRARLSLVKCLELRIGRTREPDAIQ